MFDKLSIVSDCCRNKINLRFSYIYVSKKILIKDKSSFIAKLFVRSTSIYTNELVVNKDSIT